MHIARLAAIFAVLDGIPPKLFRYSFLINRHYLFFLELLKTQRITCQARRVLTNFHAVPLSIKKGPQSILWAFLELQF
jgi:hypothetical protein